MTSGHPGAKAAVTNPGARRLTTRQRANSPQTERSVMSTPKSPKPPAAAADTASTTERWTYIGRRELSNGKLGACYLDAQHKMLVLELKLRGGAIGATYEAKVKRRADSVSVIGQPAYAVPPDPADRRVGEWEAENRAAYTAGELRKSEQRARRQGPNGSGS